MKQGDEITALLATPYLTSTGCLARAVVNDVLKGGQLKDNMDCDAENCQIS